MWEKSKIGVQIELFRDSRSRNGLDEWKVLDIEVWFSRRVWILTVITYREPMIPFGT